VGMPQKSGGLGKLPQSRGTFLKSIREIPLNSGGTPEVQKKTSWKAQRKLLEITREIARKVLV